MNMMPIHSKWIEKRNKKIMNFSESNIKYLNKQTKQKAEQLHCGIYHFIVKIIIHPLKNMKISKNDNHPVLHLVCILK